MKTLTVLLLASFAWGGENGAINGHVLKVDGKPWPDAAVTAYLLAEKSVWNKTVNSGGDGRYEFRDLAPGRYLLVYRPKAQAKPDTELAKIVDGLLRDVTLKLVAKAKKHGNIVTVASGKTITKELRQPKRVTTRIVVLCAGNPVPDAEVELMAVDKRGKAKSNAGLGGQRLPRTDRHGVAAIPRVPIGRYVVIVKMGDWNAFAGTHEVRGSPFRIVPVELGAYAVDVKIVDGAGQPVTRAMVSVWWGAEDYAWDFVRTRDMQEILRKDGVYEVPYVRAGKIVVWINAKGDATGKATVPAVGKKNPMPEIVVQLDPTAVLIVRVLDAMGSPVSGVHVNIENADDARGVPAFGYDVNRLGEHRQDVTLRRWRVRIDDFKHGRGEWTIVTPKANEKKVVELRLPKKK